MDIALAIPQVKPSVQRKLLELERSRQQMEFAGDMVKSGVALLATVPALPMIGAWVFVSSLENRGVISNADQIVLKSAIVATASSGPLENVFNFIGGLLPG